jgi:hypothetical protein
LPSLSFSGFWYSVRSTSPPRCLLIIVISFISVANLQHSSNICNISRKNILRKIFKFYLKPTLIFWIADVHWLYRSACLIIVTVRTFTISPLLSEYYKQLQHLKHFVCRNVLLVKQSVWSL